MGRNNTVLKRLRARISSLRLETQAIYLAYRDPRTPKLAKVVAFLTVAYALSPIDLIPDFIPILGLLDDLLIVPAGMSLSLKMIPIGVMKDARERAKDAQSPGSRVQWFGAAMILLFWLVLVLLALLIIFRIFKISA